MEQKPSKPRGSCWDKVGHSTGPTAHNVLGDVVGLLMKTGKQLWALITMASRLIFKPDYIAPAGEHGVWRVLLSRTLEPNKDVISNPSKKKKMWHWSVNNRSTRKLTVYILKVFVVVFVCEWVWVCARAHTHAVAGVTGVKWVLGARFWALMFAHQAPLN